MDVQDVNKNNTFQVQDGVQKILANKLSKVEGGDELAKDIQNSINDLIISPKVSKKADKTKDDIEDFFMDIQGSLRNFDDSYESNNEKNKEKVVKDQPEVGNFIDEFDSMVEQVQNKYGSKKINSLKESYLSYIKQLNRNILKESKQKKESLTKKDFIKTLKHQTGIFFESKGISQGNSKYHEYLGNVTDKEFKYLQTEGKRLIITEGRELLSPYFGRNKNKFKIKKLLREGFEQPKQWVDKRVQQEPIDTSIQMEPIEYQEDIPAWKDETFDDYDFQFMYLSYIDNDENLIVSNNPELEQKLTDLQQSLYNNTNNLETGWETETGISTDIKEQDGKESILSKFKNFISNKFDEDTKRLISKQVDEFKSQISPQTSEDMLNEQDVDLSQEEPEDIAKNKSIISQVMGRYPNFTNSKQDYENVKKQIELLNKSLPNSFGESQNDFDGDFISDSIDELEDVDDLTDLSDDELDSMIDRLMQKKEKRNRQTVNESVTYNDIISDNNYDVGDQQRLEISDEITDKSEIDNFLREHPRINRVVDSQGITSIVTITNDMGKGHEVEQFYYSKDKDEPKKYHLIDSDTFRKNEKDRMNRLKQMNKEKNRR